MEKVLVVGISGGLGRLLARRLMKNFDVCGVDRVHWEGHPRGIRVHIVDFANSPFEELIRDEVPAAVVQLGFGHHHFRGDPEPGRDVNLRTTKRLLDECGKSGVKRVVILSSGYVYGAIPENPYYLDEDSPLFAGRSDPEIRELIEVEALASAFLGRCPQIRTSVLRPVNVLGYYTHSMIDQYLRQRRVFTVMGFDPMMQFIHEEDLGEAIALTLEHRLRGVFNITGPGEVPLRTAIREAGGSAFPIPEPLLRPLFNRLLGLGLCPYPSGAIDFLKYPITLSGRRFTHATGFRPHYGIDETLQSVQK